MHQSATFAVRKNYMNFSLRKKNVRKNRKKLMVGLNEEKNHLLYSRIILVVVVKIEGIGESVEKNQRWSHRTKTIMRN